MSQADDGLSCIKSHGPPDLSTVHLLIHGIRGKELAGPQEAIECCSDAHRNHGLVLRTVIRLRQVLLKYLEISHCYSASGRLGGTVVALHSAKESRQASGVQAVIGGCTGHKMMADGGKVHFHGGNTSRLP